MIYRILRNIHLALGLSGFAFLMMYGLSAVQMAHNSWFNLKPRVSESLAAVTPSVTPRALAAHLIRDHGLRGELQQVREEPPRMRLRIVRPGTVYEIDYAAGSAEAKVRTSTAGFWGMLNRIHHVHGVAHEYAVMNVWGWLVFAISLAVFGIGVSGVYLWFKIHAERTAGMWILAAALAYAVTMLAILRSAG